ncbi:MAG: hypothetical protein ACRD7E_21130 [Bryobacteraceae bacterium]
MRSQPDVVMVQISSSSTFALLASTACCFALAGLWGSFLPNQHRMSLDEVFGIIAATASLWALRKPVHTLRIRFAKFAAIIVSLSGLLSLSQYLFAWPAPELWSGVLGRPAPYAALMLLLLGLALLLMDYKVLGMWPAEAFALTASLVALLAIEGWLLRVDPFYIAPGKLVVSLPAALAFLSVALAIFAVRPRRGLVRILRSKGQAGVVVLRLLWMPFLVPFALGAILFT